MQSSPMNARRAVLWTGRLVLGSVFVYAGVAKLLFSGASSLLAHALPFVEIALGLLLLIGRGLRLWAGLVSAVMLVFLFAVTRAYLLHMDINCGCFGTPEKLTGWTVLRDAAFAALGVGMTVCAFIEAKKPHPWSEPRKTKAIV